jgi:hypothetical protein
MEQYRKLFLPHTEDFLASLISQNRIYGSRRLARINGLGV